MAEKKKISCVYFCSVSFCQKRTIAWTSVNVKSAANIFDMKLAPSALNPRNASVFY